MNSDEMSPDERVAEIVSIMAQAVVRLKSRKARKSKGESIISLDSIGNQSVSAFEHAETKEKPCKPVY